MASGKRSCFWVFGVPLDLKFILKPQYKHYHQHQQLHQYHDDIKHKIIIILFITSFPHSSLSLSLLAHIYKHQTESIIFKIDQHLREGFKKKMSLLVVFYY